MRIRTDLIVAGAASALVVAFAVSFVRGIAREDDEALPEEATVLREPPPEAAEGESRGRVEVLNASGRGGLARRATEELRDAGFDVVYFGNARGGADSSVVIARVAEDAVARGAADRLAIGRVRVDLDSALFVDATVVVGVDWRGKMIAVTAQRAEERSWLARLLSR